jgi:uncharacterized repeat protein (TIGR03806 family)
MGAMILVVALTGCGESFDQGVAAGAGDVGEMADDGGPLPSPCVPSDPALIPHDKLTEYCFFAGPLAAERPADGVVPFTVNVPLWADRAGKGRFIVLPDGEAIEVAEDQEEWVFPVGTILIKSFYFSLDRRDPEGPYRLIETRLLIHEADGWTGHTYIYDDDALEAVRHVAGKRVQVSFTDEAGEAAEQEYLVPNTNQCKNCHERDDVVRVLGPITAQMNVGDQLERLGSLGMFSAPLGDDLDRMAAPDGPGPLEDRARDYLHAQCAHCHREGGGGGRSGLSLLRWEDDPHTYGVCKRPVAAGDGTGGFFADIVPGDPEHSILVYRMKSTDPEIKMPEIPNLLPDEEGIALVSEWITSLGPPGCFGD